MHTETQRLLLYNTLAIDLGIFDNREKAALFVRNQCWDNYQEWLSDNEPEEGKYRIIDMMVDYGKQNLSKLKKSFEEYEFDEDVLYVETKKKKKDIRFEWEDMSRYFGDYHRRNHLDDRLIDQIIARQRNLMGTDHRATQDYMRFTWSERPQRRQLTDNERIEMARTTQERRAIMREIRQERANQRNQQRTSRSNRSSRTFDYIP